MRYRVYYNRSEDPQRWSVDEGDPSTEITVMRIEFNGCTASSETRDGENPKAWFNVEGELHIAHGIAVFGKAYGTHGDKS